MTQNTLSPQAVKAKFETSQEVALLDVREHGEYGEAHPFHTVNLPFSRFELLLEQLVPRRDVTVVVFDQKEEGRARACAVIAEELGYTRVHVLSGGADGWADAGYTLFAGVNVPSKTFGELVHEVYHTPSISANQLAQWQADGKPVMVLDGRPKSEYRKMSIPGSYSCPNGELALRATHMIPDAERPIAVNCGGRTRSIVGAQTLRWLGIKNPVYALENGTQGWRLAGHELEQGQTRFYPEVNSPTPELARRIRRHAIDYGVIALSAPEARLWLTEQKTTTYLFDVRTAEEYARGHLPGAIHAPGGQLVQATDHWIGVTGARVILLDDEGCRAPMTATWLSMMGIKSAWYDGDEVEWQQYNPAPAPARVQAMLPSPEELTLDADLLSASTLVDCRSSTAFREGHAAAAHWLNRSLLTRQLQAIAPTQPLLIVATDADSARLIAKDLLVAGHEVRGWILWSQAAAEAAGVDLAATPDTPSDAECLDYLFFVHDRHAGNMDAARRYLEWEMDLVGQLDAEERNTFRFPSMSGPGEKTV
ncbi:MAG: rhodanese-like domain-containing protein [Natronospirillum sp.]